VKGGVKNKQSEKKMLVKIVQSIAFVISYNAVFTAEW